MLGLLYPLRPIRMNQCVLHGIWRANLDFSSAVQHLKGHLVIMSRYRGLSVSWVKGKVTKTAQAYLCFMDPSLLSPHMGIIPCCSLQLFVPASVFQVYNLSLFCNFAVQTRDNSKTILKAHNCIPSMKCVLMHVSMGVCARVHSEHGVCAQVHPGHGVCPDTCESGVHPNPIFSFCHKVAQDSLHCSSLESWDWTFQK